MRLQRLLICAALVLCGNAVAERNPDLSERCVMSSAYSNFETADVCWLPFSVVLARTEDLAGRAVMIQGFSVILGSEIIIYSDKEDFLRGNLFDSLYISRTSSDSLRKKLMALSPGYVRLTVEVTPTEPLTMESWTAVRLLATPQCIPSIKLPRKQSACGSEINEDFKRPLVEPQASKDVRPRGP